MERISRALTLHQAEELTKEIEGKQVSLLGISGEVAEGYKHITLLKLSEPERDYYFHLISIQNESSKFPQGVRRILEDASICKVGTGIDNLRERLRSDYNLSLHSTLDIDILSRSLDLPSLEGESPLDFHQRLINSIHAETTVSEEEKDNYKEWILAYLEKVRVPIKEKSLVNYTVSSYLEWRHKYSKEKKKELARRYLHLFRESISYDPLTTKYSLRE